MAHGKKEALIIFAREPEDGKVKTRLLKDLPAKTVTKLYKTLVKGTLKTALEASAGANRRNGVVPERLQRFIYYTGGNGNSSLPFLGRFKNKFQFKQQRGRDLGERMYRAFLNSRKMGFDKTVVIGTDCPSLTCHDIQAAFKKLSRCDVVLGPSKDGGYYLIGLNKPLKKLFENISWSTDTVLQATRQRARQFKKKVALLKTRQDIDTIEDL